MPHDLMPQVPNLHQGALTVALIGALASKCQGVRCATLANFVPLVTTLENNVPVDHVGYCFIGMSDTAQPADDTIALNFAAAHDPVFLTADKTAIQANGTDTATITVTAPKSGAAAVTLVCTPPNGVLQTELITLVAGVGTMQFKSFVQGVFVIAVQNPANRSTDAITVIAS